MTTIPITVRPAEEADIPRLVTLDQALFSGMPTLTAEHFTAWLQNAPSLFLVGLYDNTIVGYLMAVQVPRESITDNWGADTANGMCTNHNPAGDIMYGVSLGSQQPRVGAALFEEGLRLTALTPKVTEAWLYSRLSRFSEWLKSHGTGNLEEDVARYVQARVDRTQRFYESVGMNTVRGVPHYFPGDRESAECAALMSLSIPPVR